MKTEKGFTLIELMVVVAILAIIVTIGYPLYIEQSYKARRADAKVAIVDAAAVLERCRTNTNTYVGCYANQVSPEGYYDLSAAAAANTYTITAAAKSGAAQAKDTKCASFTLTHTGAKSATSSDCW